MDPLAMKQIFFPPNISYYYFNLVLTHEVFPDIKVNWISSGFGPKNYFFPTLFIFDRDKINNNTTSVLANSQMVSPEILVYP